VRLRLTSKENEPIGSFIGRSVAAEIKPPIDPLKSDTALLDYVVSINIRRRHLTESQRSMAMANLCRLERGTNQFVQKAMDGQICPSIHDDRSHAPTRDLTPDPIQATGMPTSVAAEKAGVGIVTMQHAMAVDRRGAPELVEAVSAGTSTC